MPQHKRRARKPHLRRRRRPRQTERLLLRLGVRRVRTSRARIKLVSNRLLLRNRRERPRCRLRHAATAGDAGGDFDPEFVNQDSANSGGSDANNTHPPVAQEADQSKVKHDGGEDDVDAIGNRKVGGRGMGDWYSLETEIKMGKQYSMQVENSVKLVQDPVVNEYVNRIGQNLVRNSDAKVPFTIKVIDSDEINAFALPGGFFYVNSGLILAADEEAELAGVMAHEISHVCARHQMRQMTRANIAQLGTLPLIFVGGGIGYGIYEAAGLGPAADLHEVPAQL